MENEILNCLSETERLQKNVSKFQQLLWIREDDLMDEINVFHNDLIKRIEKHRELFVAKVKTNLFDITKRIEAPVGELKSRLKKVNKLKEMYKTLDNDFIAQALREIRSDNLRLENDQNLKSSCTSQMKLTPMPEILDEFKDALEKSKILNFRYGQQGPSAADISSHYMDTSCSSLSKISSTVDVVAHKSSFSNNNYYLITPQQLDYSSTQRVTTTPTIDPFSPLIFDTTQNGSKNEPLLMQLPLPSLYDGANSYKLNGDKAAIPQAVITTLQLLNDLDSNRSLAGINMARSIDIPIPDEPNGHSSQETDLNVNDLNAVVNLTSNSVKSETKKETKPVAADEQKALPQTAITSPQLLNDLNSNESFAAIDMASSIGIPCPDIANTHSSQETEVPFTLLNEHCRMPHPDIKDLVSELTKTIHNCVKKNYGSLQLPRNFPTMMTGFPIAWVNVTTPESTTDENSKLTENIGEAETVVKLAATLIGLFGMKSCDIVIVTSYSAQVLRLRTKIEEACVAINNREYMTNSNLEKNKFQEELRAIAISTVDSFQGQESNVVIYSIVRSNPYFTIGLLENDKNLNITIGRARCLLMIIGNATMFPSLGNSKCFVSKDQVNNPGRVVWRHMLEWCIKNRCVLNERGHQEQLPHEKCWPCVGNIGQTQLIQIVSSSRIAVTISVRVQFVTEFRMTAMPRLLREHCNIRIAQSECETGWQQIIISNVNSRHHDTVMSWIREPIEQFENIRKETRRCFTEPSIENRGEFCLIRKGAIFRGDLQIPRFMDGMHYRDADYALSHGIKVLSRHRVLWHIHIRHDIFRLLIGILSRKPFYVYDKFKNNKMRLISEEGTRATMYEFMCAFLTTTKGYSPEKHLSLQEAYDYCCKSLHDLITEWASWDKIESARQEADKLAAKARQRGHNVPMDVFY